MKYAPSIYARAFWESKPDSRKFLKAVGKNGDFARIDHIVAALENYTTKKNGGRVIHLEVARDQKLIEKFKFTAKDRVRVSINPSLVAGIKISIDGERELDMSLTRKLNKLFS